VSTTKGALLGWLWVLPFVSLLLSIATGPVLFPKIWNRHYGKIAAGWSALTIASIALVYGVPAALSSFMHAALDDYLSFIVLLFALYTVAGGILITGKLQGLGKYGDVGARHAHGQCGRNHRRFADSDPATYSR
jgi:hypothetical protein